ncbi:MAG TPA: SIS domain-containing protein [Pseudonocardiaceae bacterium]|nr:SIS domain-containing protein [Pseudonocardiaceae bacterium]
MNVETNIAAKTYAHEALQLLTAVAAKAEPNVEAAARLFARCLKADGVIHAFGTGHSQATAMEVAGRAGGFVPTNRISLSDVVMFGGADPATLADPMLERQADAASRLYELAKVQPQDLFVISSNSGVNGAIVQLALLVKERGHDLVALTSLDHSYRVPARHESGKRLADLADVVLDNGAPYGDAMFTTAHGDSACAVSSLSAALLVQMTVAQAVRILLDEGVRPPLYVSANVPDGPERNRALEARYAGRIRRIAS